MTDISKAVRHRMKALSFTDKALSIESGVSTHIIWKIKHDKNYEVDALVKVLGALGLQLQALPCVNVKV